MQQEATAYHTVGLVRGIIVGIHVDLVFTTPTGNEMRLGLQQLHHWRSCVQELNS